jgi:hypothetical protein
MWSAAQASERVQVNWAPAEHYLGPQLSPEEFPRAQRILTEEMETLGGQYLQGDEHLTIEVVDLQLAGHLARSGVRGDYRVLDGRVDWPRLTLRFDLKRAGKTVKAGEKNLAELDYLRFPEINSHEPLPYERRLLEKWFKAQFAPAPNGAN